MPARKRPQCRPQLGSDPIGFPESGGAWLVSKATRRARGPYWDFVVAAIDQGNSGGPSKAVRSSARTRLARKFARPSAIVFGRRLIMGISLTEQACGGAAPGATEAHRQHRGSFDRLRNSLSSTGRRAPTPNPFALAEIIRRKAPADFAGGAALFPAALRCRPPNADTGADPLIKAVGLARDDRLGGGFGSDVEKRKLSMVVSAPSTQIKDAERSGRHGWLQKCGARERAAIHLGVMTPRLGVEKISQRRKGIRLAGTKKLLSQVLGVLSCTAVVDRTWARSARLREAAEKGCRCDDQLVTIYFEGARRTRLRDAANGCRKGAEHNDPKLALLGRLLQTRVPASRAQAFALLQQPGSRD